MALFDSFTKRARRAMERAQEEARRYDHDYLGTEHVLLALLAEREGAAARALDVLGVDEQRAREAIEAVVARGDGPAEGEGAPTPRLKRALELAVREAQSREHRFLGTEHLLLGIMAQGDNVAVGVLSHLGVTAPLVVEQIDLTLLEGAPSSTKRLVETALGRVRGRKETAPAEVKGNVITCRVTDRDLAAIDALVEAGIRSTRSDAAAWLIGAGIGANGELFTRLHATIDQIRQLRADAQALVDRANAPDRSPAQGDDAVR